MSHDDEVWKLYAKSVKKIRKVESLPSNTSTASFRRKPQSGEPLHKNKINHFDPSRKDVWIPAYAGMTPIDQVHSTLDRRTEKNLRSGDVAIQARLDLHGMTQPEAFDALADFMARAVKSGKRNLLIITGKGSKSDGVLRANLSQWLQALPEAGHILTLRPAAPKHGGTGAFYVMLKKQKHSGT